ncbi:MULTISPECIES: hypothetical protein [unclassified Acinetobacter]|uniref:hypothetical protein n=1 Tax=unclassified Acinetobacter TaxID=196816 RepID=UPI0035B9E1B8
MKKYCFTILFTVIFTGLFNQNAVANMRLSTKNKIDAEMEKLIQQIDKIAEK